MKQKTFNIKDSADKAAKSHTIYIEGDLSLKNAIALKKGLHSFKFDGHEVIIHLKNIEKLDITFIQTLLSLKKSLTNNGKKTQVLAELPSDLVKLLKNTGFNNIF